ncbi:hypothetical protein PG989_010892 [Apiospora arundinis]
MPPAGGSGTVVSLHEPFISITCSESCVTWKTSIRTSPPMLSLSGSPMREIYAFDAMVLWCQIQMKSRIEDKSRYKEPDITHYIMMEDEENNEVVKDAL